MINADRGPSVPLPDTPCWYCVHWAGPAWGDPYMADCRFDNRKSCKPDARHGCVHWMREPGVDDDGWAPAPLIRPRTPERPPFVMTPELYATCRRIQAELDRKATTR